MPSIRVMVAGAVALVCVVLTLGFVPPVARKLDSVACNLVAKQVYWPAARIFAYLAATGDAAARNNLGVLTLHGLGTRMDTIGARRLFDAAAARGNSVAVYNQSLAAYGNDGADIAAKQRTLLEKLVADGDPHAAAQLSSRIDGRSFEEGAQADRARELLEFAADSGDEDYKLLLAARILVPPGARPRTIDAARFESLIAAVFASNETKAASFIAGYYEEIQVYGLEGDLPFAQHDQWGWYKEAADAGRLDAICRIGIWANHEVKSKRGTVTVEQVRQSLPYLQACASLPHGRYGRQAPQIFGNPSLYGGKATESLDLGVAPQYAMSVLADMYGTGFGVDVDTAKALRYRQKSIEY